MYSLARLSWRRAFFAGRFLAMTRPRHGKGQAMHRLLVGPDWSSWVVIVVVVLLVCALVWYWASLASV